jgi:hypothetical protein
MRFPERPSNSSTVIRKLQRILRGQLQAPRPFHGISLIYGENNTLEMKSLWHASGNLSQARLICSSPIAGRMNKETWCNLF